MNLLNVDGVLPIVADALKKLYGAENVLLTSLRGKVKHLHFHLVPLTTDAEKTWREYSSWSGGHLHQFLGVHENASAIRNLQERRYNGWTELEQNGRAHQ